MKYVAILESDAELSEEILEDIKSATFVGGSPAPYSCTISNITKAPEKAHYDSMWSNLNYNQALKDCGVIEDDSN